MARARGEKTGPRIATSIGVLAFAVAACGATSTASSPKAKVKATTTTTTATTTTATTTTTAPQRPATTTTKPVSSPHVMIVMMENKSFSEVIGQADQPYTNNLANTYGLATQSYAFGHPSLPNYLDIVSGSNQGVTDDGPPSSHKFPSTQTLADQLVAAGFSAKAYAENLPPDPTNSLGEYAVRHVPWEYFPSARISVANASSIVGDLNAANAPDFVWYTPNLINDEHDGSVQQGEAFLSKLIPEVQSTSWYRSGGRIIVEWDESDADNSGVNGSGGGHVATIVVSSSLRASPKRVSTPVNSAGILRSLEDAFGLAHLGAARDAANGNIDALLGATPGP
jgi:acid phosphatase